MDGDCVAFLVYSVRYRSFRSGRDTFFSIDSRFPILCSFSFQVLLAFYPMASVFDLYHK